MIKADIEYAPFNAAVDSLYECLLGQGKDATNVLVDEHKRLVQTIVNFTPPSPPVKGSQARGENAIRSDLESLITEVNDSLIDRIGSEHGIKDIETWIVGKKGNPIELHWENIVLNEDRLEELHNSYRNKNGRPGRARSVEGQWRARIVVPLGMRESYIKKVQERVGRWKAKWALSAAKMGAKFPRWISRHFSDVEGKSYHVTKLGGDSEQYIMFGGQGRNFRENIHHVQGALKMRAKAIRRRIELLVSNYSKDIAQKMKAEVAAHKAYDKGPGEEAVD